MSSTLGNGTANTGEALGTPLPDADKVDVRRYLGYPAYGAGSFGNMGWRFFQQYGALEYRMNNLTAAEVATVQAMLASCRVLEQQTQQMGSATGDLDIASAGPYERNPAEMPERIKLYRWQRFELLGMFNVPPGPMLQGNGYRMVV